VAPNTPRYTWIESALAAGISRFWLSALPATKERRGSQMGPAALVGISFFSSAMQAKLAWG
jgi:hypothetical protein